MLSRKYLTIKKAMTRFSKTDLFHRKAIVFAQMYMDINKGFRFSYVSDENGETDYLDTLSRHFDKDFVYFDVGAHIGTYTDMVVGRFGEYEGHLFDVTKDTYEKCLERHGDNEKLKINNMALSDEIGEVEYRAYPDDPTRNGISGVRAEGAMETELHTAPCWTGDHYCKENGIKHINLLKVDAEGYDLHVLRGFDEMLSKGRVDTLQFEYNVKHSETGSMLGDYHAFLEERGYIVGPMRQDGVRFTKFDFTLNSFENGPNYVACRPEFAHILIDFSAERKGRKLSLSCENDLNVASEIILNSELRSSLNSMDIEVDLKKHSEEDVDDILKAFIPSGLSEQKRNKRQGRLDITLNRSDLNQKVEAEREKLGYWGKDKKAPRYSVCVCNYNMADTIERAMISVLDQLDKKLYEVVVIDDGSSDGSLSVLERLAKKYSNFRYVLLPRDPKRKLGETRNISMRAARGEYVLIHIDADDEWEPYLQDLVTLFHKMEEAAEHDFMLAGQQTGIVKRDFMLSHGGYENVYRCEDRNLMNKLAKEEQLMFLDYKVFRTRMSRPVKKKIIKTIWDDCSHMIYDLRQNEPKWPFIKFALMMPFNRKRFSLLSKIVRPLMIFPIYIMTRFMPPIINHISRAEMVAYHEKNRGTYPEVMERIGGDPDMSFLSEEAQEVYSYSAKLPGFRGS